MPLMYAGELEEHYLVWTIDLKIIKRCYTELNVHWCYIIKWFKCHKESINLKLPQSLTLNTHLIVKNKVGMTINNYINKEIYKEKYLFSKATEDLKAEVSVNAAKSLTLSSEKIFWILLWSSLKLRGRHLMG